MGCVPVVFASLPWLYLVWASSTHQQKRERQRESGPRLRASPGASTKAPTDCFNPSNPDRLYWPFLFRACF